MSFAEVVNQHWDEIHVLSQLCVIIAQSTLERRFANVEDDFTSIPSGDESRSQYNLRLMYKIVNRVIHLSKEIDDLSDVHCVFYWTSRQDEVDINKLEIWAEKILNLCDRLSLQIKLKQKDINNDKKDKKDGMNLIELNEFIEIEKYRHLTLRHLSYSLNEQGIGQTNDTLNKSLKCILKSIELCSTTNFSIKIFNKMLEEKMNANNNNNNNNNNEMIENNDNEPDETEINRMIENGELDIREESDLIGSYHFGANLCQKINKFEQSLDLINCGISILRNQLRETFKDRIEEIAEPVSSDDDNGDNTENIEDEQEDNGYLMNIDNKNDYEYTIDMELNDDIHRMMSLKDKKWNDMNGDDKLFYFINLELFDMILTRGLAFSNLSKYKLAFYDSYLCTMIHCKDITAWNNRAFAWYQLGEYIKCIKDCNFALNNLSQNAKYSKFTKGLLIGNRGLAEYKLKLYHKSVNDLNICLKYSPQSRLAREALHKIWEEFTNAIYYGCKQFNYDMDIPFVIAKIISDYGVGIDFDIIPQCHQSTIVYQ